MKPIYTTLFFLSLILLIGCQDPSKEKITKVITSHENVTIICNPSKGNNLFSSWGTFPNKEESIRRIFMEVSLGHPDSIDIAHWDYMDPIRIGRIGGTKGDTLDLEIGKMLTPYGSNFKKDWRWRWRIDVTDLASILRDSVEITYNHTGYEGANVGWDLNISFDLELGDPIAEQLSYRKLYDGGFSYGNPEKPISASLTPKTITREKGSEFGRLRILHTGHGMDKPKGCSEFCSRWREVLVDDNVIDHRDMWKECADNNLYPQGGTWIFDRAYWCPGDLQAPDVIDFPITKDTHTIDFEMEPYTAEENIQAYESISAILFQYGQPAKANDVSLEQILVPNNAPELNRYNPANVEPKIIIKNLGRDVLNSLTVTYKTKGFEEKTFEWTGELEFYEEAIIVLPGTIDYAFGENQFNVQLEKPNGKVDQWPQDNTKTSVFTSPNEMPNKVVITYQSNNAPEDNTVRIIDTNNKLIYEKTPANTLKNTLYKDTLNLNLGGYRMTLDDTANNGLEFWFNPKQGFGYLQISDIDGRVLHRFESDCGIGEQFDFTVNENPKIDRNVEQSLIKLYPRRIRKNTELLVQLEEFSDGEIQILKDGALQKTIPFKKVKDKTFDIDMSSFEDGRYVIELFVNGESKLKQRISKQNK
ncbi:peptide-N-glycosidase F-related protein [Maribacter ulvicola]|uniref:Peptide-N-glycosidase F, C terminal n=1 Tax=Maribacter ulvicola TaxID=228959 RepID=A0A1N7AME4_9FLAO|nr:peptide-N-glycosidase F-related protein [Maribacter ulvicola]SIR40310.1 Peptide-N-glycosidase F, C terminal [Maribacter ulvicola]